jgi:hypothetical protein
MAFGGEEELRGGKGVEGYWSWTFWTFGASDKSDLMRYDVQLGRIFLQIGGFPDGNSNDN